MNIYKIILFYKYIDIENPEQIKEWLKATCSSLKLKGRVLLAHEGINGTLGGPEKTINEFIAFMNTHSLFSSIDFKESFATGECFPKLIIKVRQEIVRLGIDPNHCKAAEGGKHLTPEQTHKLLEANPENLFILDARNVFEARIGKFENAHVPPIEVFRDLPKYIDEHEELFKDKQVLMYCTGGIRCERASAYLKSKGIAQEVYQLEGGIHRYVEEYPDGYFRGKNYVFDGRISMRVNNDILTQCDNCSQPYDEYTNCVNARCNAFCILCPQCLEKLENTCSVACRELLKQDRSLKRSQPAKMADTLCVQTKN